MLKLQTREETRGVVKVIRFVNENNGICLSRDMCQVEFDPDKWKRKTCERLERQIENVWLEKCTNSNVYNGNKFRFGGIDISGTSKVRLNVGLTCYKDVIGISQTAGILEWQERGADETGNSQAYISDGLGVGILAFTTDGHLVLIRRAKWTGEYPGMIDRPGGHPEPDQILADDGSWKHKVAINDEVVTELWCSSAKELVAETGVLPEQVGDQKMVGIVRNLELAGRPSMEFFTKLSASAEEVRYQYSLKKHSEAGESTSLILIPPEQVQRLLQGCLRQMGVTSVKTSSTHTNPTPRPEEIANEFTPALKGALELYAKSLGNEI